jgi:hypothetical protein
MEQRKQLDTLYKNFSVLTEKNKQGIIDMTKFLVRAQDDILPSLLTGAGSRAMKGSGIRESVK